LTEEKLNKAFFYENDNKSCQRTIVASSAKVLQFKQECAAADAKRTFDGRIEALDPETLKGSLKADSTGYAASATDLAGRWIGADCGEAAQ
jgi:hypothetical protein